MPSISSCLPPTHASRVLPAGVALVVAGLLVAACSSSGGASSAATSAPAAGGGPSSAGSLTLTDGHLTDASGRTVYLWVADKGNRSRCTGSCASAWPPVPAAGAPRAGHGLTARLITTSHRADGSTQLDYAGHPLYYFEADTADGDAKGQGSDGFGAKWWELDAAGAAITTAATPSSSASNGAGGYGY